MKSEQQYDKDVKKDTNFAPLKSIKNIRFTDREIDIIACLVGGRPYKKIASILSITHRTVEHHVRNIAMRIGCHSRDGIIDFVEKSDKFALVKAYYVNILIKTTFEQELKKLLPITEGKNFNCLIFHDELQISKTSLIYQLERHLNFAGIKTLNKVWKTKFASSLINKIETKQINCIVYALSKTFVKQLKTSGYETQKKASSLIPQVKENLCPIVFLSSDNKTSLNFNENHPDFAYISLLESDNYYFLFSDLLKKILPSNSIDANIINFKKRYKMLRSNPESQEPFENSDPSTKPNDTKDKNRKKKKNLFKWLMLFLICFIGLGFAAFKLYNKENDSFTYQPQTTNLKVTDTKQNIENQQRTTAFNLPTRNNKFTGRKDSLIQIKKQLDKQKIGIITQAIYGLGGVGKTQLAIELAYQTAEKGEYSLVCWIPAETIDTMNYMYRELARFLKIDIRGFNSTKIKALIYHELSQRYKNHKILFVLDNASSYSNIQDHLLELHKQLSPYLSLSVLITSRSQYWPENSIALNTFTAEEAIVFIKKYLPNEKEDLVIKLAKSLYYFPLALGQAIAYIKRSTNINDYLKLYESKQKDFLDKFSGDKNQYNESLWKTWNIALNKLSSTAREMLFISSYIYPDNIPIEFFDHLSVEKRTHAIESLRKHSFVILTNNNMSFSLHRLLQEVIRETLVVNNGGMKGIISNIKSKNPLSRTIELFEDKFDFSYTKPDKWESCVKYLIHAEFLADHLVNSNENKFRVKGVQLYAQIAMYLTYVRKDYKPARKIWKKISDIVREYYKNEESKLILANVSTHLGMIMRAEGENKGRLYAEKSILFYKTMTEPVKVSPDIDQLLPYFRWNRSLTKYDGIISDQSFSLFCLGLFGQEKMMDLQIAENSFKKAINLLDKNKKTNHTITYRIALFGSLGKLYVLQNNLEKAKNILASAKLLTEKNFPYHIETAYTYKYLALLQCHMGKYDDAIKNLKKCLKIRINTLSKDHYRIGYIKSVLGLMLCVNNQIEEGIENLQEVEAIYNKSSSSNLKFFILMYLSMATAFELSEDYEKALQYLIKTGDLLKKHPKYELYGSISYHFPKTEKFPTLSPNVKNINYYTQALKLTKKIFGKNHIRAARYYYLLGQVFENINDENKAKWHYQKALNIANKQKFDDKTLLEGNKKNLKIIQKKLKK